MEYKEHEEIIAKLKFLIKEKFKYEEFEKLSIYEFVDLYIKEETLNKIDTPFEEIN